MARELGSLNVGYFGRPQTKKNPPNLSTLSVSSANRMLGRVADFSS